MNDEEVTMNHTPDTAGPSGLALPLALAAELAGPAPTAAGPRPRRSAPQPPAAGAVPRDAARRPCEAEAQHAAPVARRKRTKR